MKRRLWILAAATILLTVLWCGCAAAESAGYGLTIAGTPVNSTNKDDVLGDGVFSFDPDSRTLTVSRGQYHYEYTGDLISNTGDSLRIVVSGELSNLVCNLSPGHAVIRSTGNLVFQGGVLVMNGRLQENDMKDNTYGVLLDGAGHMTVNTGAYLRVYRVTNGYEGGGAALRVYEADLYCSAEATTGLHGFTASGVIRGSTWQTPEGAVFRGGTVYQADGTTVARSVKLTVNKHELYISGMRITDANLSGLIDGTFAYRYDPDANILHLQGTYSPPNGKYAVIAHNIPGLTVQLDGNVMIYAPEADNYIMFNLMNDTVITGKYQLSLYGNSEAANTTAVLMSTGDLQLTDTDLWISNGFTYGLRCGTGSAGTLRINAAAVGVRAENAAVIGFTEGITTDGCGFVRPFRPVIDRGTVYGKSVGQFATWVTVGTDEIYSLGIDGVAVTEGNRADVLGNGVFSYDPEQNMLTVSGVYEGSANVPLIDNYMDGLIVRTASDSAHLSFVSFADEVQGVITSHGDLTLDSSVPDGALYLSSNDSLIRAGIHMTGGTLTVNAVTLNVRYVGHGLLGEEDAYFECNASTADLKGRISAMTGFTGGMSLTGCGITSPAGCVFEGGTLKAGGAVCTAAKIEPNTHFTVTFDANGHGTAPGPQEVAPGSSAAEPAEPAVADYVFCGWYTEAACVNAYSFAAPVTKDITLYAKWVSPYSVFRVTFDANGHGTAPAPQDVISGSCAAEPEEPKDADYVFCGWYREAACVNAYSFAAPVTENITLYAKWEMPFRVTFDANGHGTAPAPQDVLPGGCAAVPNEPGNADYIFCGWYAEAACVTVYNFSAPVTENTTLYAKWELPLWLGETHVTEENMNDILGDGTASYDPESHTLAFTVTEPAIRGCYGNDKAVIYSEMDLTIETNGSLRLTTGDVYCSIYLPHSSLTVKGNLIIRNPGTYAVKVGSGHLVVDGDVDIDVPYGCGFLCYDYIYIYGDFSARTGMEAIVSYGYSVIITGKTDITITGDATAGIEAYAGYVFTDGSATIRVAGTAEYGIIAYEAVISSNMSITAEPGSLTYGLACSVISLEKAFGRLDIQADYAIFFEYLYLPFTHEITVPEDARISLYPLDDYWVVYDIDYWNIYDAGHVVIEPAYAPEPYFFLPASLTTLEENAFYGIATTAVVIPDSVETIEGDPFAGSLVTTVYAYPDSAGHRYAREYNKLYIPIDDEWMNSR